MSRRRKSTDTTPFDTLRLEGSLFVPELLERAASGEATFQKETDYAIPKGLKLHDEYGRAFRIATATWQSFAPQTTRADLDAAAVTRAFVVDFLRQCLGYTDLAPLGAPIQLGDRHFPVTAQSLGGRLPVIIAPHHLGLDDPDPRFAIIGSGSRKKSAHQLAQEFLNASPDSLWAIVTNGKTLRLLRDADTLTRPNFLEFDLETILRDDQHRYADFSALWRILHASRCSGGVSPSSSPSDCIWEKWKSEGHAQGLRVRDGLRDGVTEAILILGRGFLAHPDNTALRQRLHDGTLTLDDYFQQFFRLIYRCLFLFCTEERDLLHTPDSSPAARQAYATGYSLRRFRKRSLRQSVLEMRRPPPEYCARKKSEVEGKCDLYLDGVEDIASASLWADLEKQQLGILEQLEAEEIERAELEATLPLLMSNEENTRLAAEAASTEREELLKHHERIQERISAYEPTFMPADERWRFYETQLSRVNILGDENKEHRKRQSIIRDGHLMDRLDLGEHYRSVLSSLLGPKIDGHITFDTSGQLMLDAENRSSLSSAAIEALKTISFDLASLFRSIVGGGHHPRFLIHDSPKVADMSPVPYAELFELALQVENQAAGRPNFQYIITTTEPPPEYFKTSGHIILPLDASTKDGRLFMEDL